MTPTLRTALLLCCTGLAGCTLAGIDTHPEPLVSAPAAYQASGTVPGTNGVWYQRFNDPVLDQLIGKGLSGNLTLRQALARFDAARAQSASSRADILPAIDLSADTGKIWEEGDAQDLTSSFGATLDWEIDIFGRLSAAAKADKLEEVAAGEDIQAVRLGLAADIAVAYYNAVAANHTLTLLAAQDKTDSDLQKLVELREQQGVGTQVEVLQQKSQRALNQSLIPVAEASLRGFENRLDTLTGSMPDSADVTTKDSVFPQDALNPPASVPSDLLLNRPDLRAARARLIAADADIAAAIADRLPHISLSGSYLLSHGGDAASPALGLLAGLVQPLLDWGKREAEVKRNKALYEEQLAAFSQLYLEAVEDVETTFYQIAKQKEYIARLHMREAILRETLDKTRAVYKEGLSDYLPVLDALQDLRAVERTIVEEERDLVLLHIQLYRALGGEMP